MKKIKIVLWLSLIVAGVAFWALHRTPSFPLPETASTAPSASEPSLCPSPDGSAAPRGRPPQTELPAPVSSVWHDTSPDLEFLHRLVQQRIAQAPAKGPPSRQTDRPPLRPHWRSIKARGGAASKIHPLLLQEPSEAQAAVSSQAYPRRDAHGRILVRIRYRPGPHREALIKEMLHEQGSRVFARLPQEGIVEAYIPRQGLDRWAEQPWVGSLAPVAPFRTRVGPVTTEADQVLGIAELRKRFQVTGSGIKIGVISDGVDSLNQAQLSGELPEGINVLANGAGFTTASGGGADEGTAMLEIIHDLAPDAQLFFHDGLSETRFVQAVRSLREQGCRVIVDDLGFASEPFYEDGPAAREVQAAVDAGVTFVSAAGNDAQRHAELNWSSEHLDPDAPNVNEAVFDVPALVFPSDSEFMEFSLGPGTSLTVILQWTEPFGASSHDYDVVIYHADEYRNFLDQALTILEDGSSGASSLAALALGLSPVGASLGAQNGTQDPVEILSIQNSGALWAPLVLLVEGFDNVSGSDTLEMFFWHKGDAGVEGIPGPAGTPRGSVFGHPAAAGCLAVGAIDVNDPGLDTLQPFSSQGPRRMPFSSDSLRNKPDVVTVDGVSVSGAGSFPPRFFGTSAAAPHTAAFAALLLESDPQLSPAGIREIFADTAVDLGPTGRDNLFGYGFIDMEKALDGADGDIVVVDSDDSFTWVAFESDQLIDLRLKVEAGEPLWVLLEFPDLHNGLVLARPSDRLARREGRYLFVFEERGEKVPGADSLYYSRSFPSDRIDFGVNDFSDLGRVIITTQKGESSAGLLTIQQVELVPGQGGSRQ